MLQLSLPFFLLLYCLLELNSSLFSLLLTELIEEGKAKNFGSNSFLCVSEREEDERKKTYSICSEATGTVSAKARANRIHTKEALNLVSS